MRTNNITRMPAQRQTAETTEKPKKPKHQNTKTPNINARAAKGAIPRDIADRKKP
jgi:hypothetical protein